MKIFKIKKAVRLSFQENRQFSVPILFKFNSHQLLSSNNRESFQLLQKLITKLKQTVMRGKRKEEQEKKIIIIFLASRISIEKDGSYVNLRHRKKKIQPKIFSQKWALQTTRNILNNIILWQSYLFISARHFFCIYDWNSLDALWITFIIMVMMLLVMLLTLKCVCIHIQHMMVSSGCIDFFHTFSFVMTFS